MYFCLSCEHYVGGDHNKRTVLITSFEMQQIVNIWKQNQQFKITV
jgi:hypothetical protein